MYVTNHLLKYLNDDPTIKRVDDYDLQVYSPVCGYLDHIDEINDIRRMFIYSPSKNNDKTNAFVMPFDGEVRDMKITSNGNIRDPIFKVGYPSTDLYNNKYYYPYSLSFKLISKSCILNEAINTLNVTIFFGDRDDLLLTSDYGILDKSYVSLDKGDTLFTTKTPMRTILNINISHHMNPDLVKQLFSDPIVFQNKNEHVSIDRLIKLKTLISWF